MIGHVIQKISLQMLKSCSSEMHTFSYILTSCMYVVGVGYVHVSVGALTCACKSPGMSVGTQAYGRTACTLKC